MPAIPLDVARLCLDCDLLLASSVCPLCGSDRAVPVSRWLAPLRAEPGGNARGDGMTSRPDPVPSLPGRIYLG
jgi:hypothetical protein